MFVVEEGIKLELPNSLKITDIEHVSLNNNLVSIEEAVKYFWTEKVLDHYTEHGISHSEKIIKHIGRLLENKQNALNDYEKFILVAAIYLHDIGMQSPKHAGLELKPKSEYTSEELEIIRDRHHETSEKVILESVKPKSNLSLGLEHCKEYATMIARIAKYHRKFDINELEVDCINSEEIRLPLLAALIRFGDELDIDRQRVNIKILELIEIPTKSKYHWWKHIYVNGVMISEGIINIYFSFPEAYKNNNQHLVEVLKNDVSGAIKERYKEVYDTFFKYNIHIKDEIVIKANKYEITQPIMPPDLEEYIVDRISNSDAKLDKKKGFSLITQKIHTSIMCKYLEEPYKKLEIESKEFFNIYSDILKLVCNIQETTIDYTENIFCSMSRYVQKSNNIFPIKVDGPAGSGKTMLLSLLYWYLHYEYINDNRKPIPIYIDINYYESKIYKNSNLLSYEAQVVNALDNDQSFIVNFINKYPDTEIIFIIDGLDDYNKIKEVLMKKINETIINNSSIKKIIGESIRKYDVKNGSLSESSVVIRLFPIPFNGNYCDEFLNKFICINNNGDSKSYFGMIKEYFEELHVREIDILTLSLVFKMIKENPKSKNYTIGEMFHSYCKRLINSQNGTYKDPDTIIMDAGKLAYNIEIKEQNVTNPRICEWKLIHLHSSVREYLIANYIIKCLVDFSQGNDSCIEVLSYLYNHKINYYCKDIMNEDIKIQEKVYNAVEKVYQIIIPLLFDENHEEKRHSSRFQNFKDNIVVSQESQINKLDHMNILISGAYLIGRLCDANLRNNAKIFLEKIKKKISDYKSTSYDIDDIKTIFLIRTVYISLIYLGQYETQTEYIELLIQRHEWDKLNRGFHLEYYGDIPYNQSSQLDMYHDDDLREYPNTYRVLRKNIIDNLKSHQYIPFNINYYTFCSLIQHRHIKSEYAIELKYHILEDSYVEDAIMIIEQVIKNVRVSGKLLDYSNMLLRNLKGDFSFAKLTSDLYRMKTIPRTGWVKRELTNVESLAEHSYSALQMAYFYLSEKTDKYNKNKIINMLLIHDVAEIYTGDIPFKTPVQKKEEENEWNYMGMLSTYDSLNSFREASNLWYEFEKGKSLEASIARDFDKLDNLIQLYIYEKSNTQPKIIDFEEWKSELNNSITTDEVRNIARIINSYY